MEKEIVFYQKKESVAIVTLNRASSKNAINTQLVVEFEDILDEISIERDVKVVIITGKETFSAGTDREAFSSFDRKEEPIRSLSVSTIVDAFDRPTIAAINGDALGQGLELALACDLRICTETAHFAMNHITYGGIPWDGGTQRLSRLAGRGKAMEMTLTGKVIDAQEAHHIGIVHRVVPYEELSTVAMDMARKMASKGPLALRYAKETINNGMDLTLEQGLRLEADLYFLLHTTGDRTEGIKAFREKRPPRFKGR